MAQLPWGEELHFQFLEGVPIFLFDLTLFLSTRQKFLSRIANFRPTRL